MRTGPDFPRTILLWCRVSLLGGITVHKNLTFLILIPRARVLFRFRDLMHCAHFFYVEGHPPPHLHFSAYGPQPPTTETNTGSRYGVDVFSSWVIGRFGQDSMLNQMISKWNFLWMADSVAPGFWVNCLIVRGTLPAWWGSKAWLPQAASQALWHHTGALQPQWPLPGLAPISGQDPGIPKLEGSFQIVSEHLLLCWGNMKVCFGQGEILAFSRASLIFGFSEINFKKWKAFKTSQET